MDDETSDHGEPADGAGAPPLLPFAPQALKKVQEIRASEPDGDKLALWLEVSGAAQGEYTYDLYFDVSTRPPPRTP